MQRGPGMTLALCVGALLSASCEADPDGIVDYRPVESHVGSPDDLDRSARDELAHGQILIRTMPQGHGRHPWLHDLSLLEDAVRAQDGHVLIGIKEPASTKSLMSGVRESLTRSTYRRVVDSLAFLGAEVVSRMEAFGLVHARVPTHLVAQLNAMSAVDFVERRLWLTSDAVPAMTDAASVRRS